LRKSRDRRAACKLYAVFFLTVSPRQHRDVLPPCFSYKMCHFDDVDKCQGCIVFCAQAYRSMSSFLNAIVAPLHRSYPVDFGLRLKRKKNGRGGKGTDGTQTAEFGRNIGLKLGEVERTLIINIWACTKKQCRPNWECWFPGSWHIDLIPRLPPFCSPPPPFSSTPATTPTTS